MWTWDDALEVPRKMRPRDFPSPCQDMRANDEFHCLRALLQPIPVHRPNEHLRGPVHLVTNA